MKVEFKTVGKTLVAVITQGTKVLEYRKICGVWYDQNWREPNAATLQKLEGAATEL